MKLLETANARLALFAGAFASLAAVGAWIADAGQFLDDAIITPAEHASDIVGLTSTLDTIDSKLDRSAAREAVVAIKNIMANACAGDGAISERGQEVIDEQLGIYSNYYGKELAIGVCHEGQYITQTNARLLGLQ